MNEYPFSIFKRTDRSFYLVSFKDENGKYLPPISTKKRMEDEAKQTAFLWLRDGIPQKQATLDVTQLSLKDTARKIVSKAEAEVLLKELKRQSKVLRDITAEDIDGFISFMGDKELSPSRKNQVMLAGTKPLRWAFSKGKIETDSTRGHILFSGEATKKQILSPHSREGEIMGLQVQDLGPDCLYVRHSFNSMDKLKVPKNGETRQVELPFADLTQGLFELAQKNPWGVSPESFVFWTERRADAPMAGRHCVDGLREALEKVGFSKEAAAGYMFHGWRHFYTSYMIEKLGKKLLKSQTGHRTGYDEAVLSTNSGVLRGWPRREGSGKP